MYVHQHSTAISRNSLAHLWDQTGLNMKKDCWNTLLTQYNTYEWASNNDESTYKMNDTDEYITTTECMGVPGDLSATKHIQSLLVDINSHVMIKQQTRSAHSWSVVSNQCPFICLQLVHVEVTLQPQHVPLHHYTSPQSHVTNCQ